MAMQARQVKLIITRDIGRRLARSQAAVDFGALEMLARSARSLLHARNETPKRLRQR